MIEFDGSSLPPLKSFLSHKLEVRPMPAKGGLGIFAHQEVLRNELVVVFGGYILCSKELSKLPIYIQQGSIQVDADLYLTDIPLNNTDRVNHSCEPNVGLQGSRSLVAMRNIAPGEEICFDYATSDSSSYDEFECFCRSPHCRQQITGKDWLYPELWKRYAGYFSPYLEKQINQLQNQPNQGGHET